MRQIRSELFVTAFGLTLLSLFLTSLTSSTSRGAAPGQFGTPKGEEGTRIFKATEHPNYSGQFRLTGRGTVFVGIMHDLSPWAHMDYAGKRLNPLPGRISIEVDERTNTVLALMDCVK